MANSIQKLFPTDDGYPFVARLLKLEMEQMGQGLYQQQAELLFDREPYSIRWIGPESDISLINELVMVETIRYPNQEEALYGMQAATQPVPGLNIFSTIPDVWIEDPHLAQRAAVLWENLSTPLAHLINTIFWDRDRLLRFIQAPASLHDRHADIHGYFRRSVEVGEMALKLASGQPAIDRGLLVAGALLRDAGKLATYSWDERVSSWELSVWGELVSHRDILNGWLGQVRTQCPDVDEALFLALLHVINASPGKPDHLGPCKSRLREAVILSRAGLLSTPHIHVCRY